MPEQSVTGAGSNHFVRVGDFPIFEIYDGLAFLFQENVCVCVAILDPTKKLHKIIKRSANMCQPSDLPGQRQGPTLISHSALLFQSSTWLNCLNLYILRPQLDFNFYQIQLIKINI